MNKINDFSMKKSIIINFIIAFIISSFCQIKCFKFDLVYSQYSKITLRINVTGYNNILGNDFGGPLPDKININGNKASQIQKEYDFEQTDNYVTLIFNDNLVNNCDNMFKECSNIMEIDLSGFNAFLVTSMVKMFEGCSSLNSLNLSNFDIFSTK